MYRHGTSRLYRRNLLDKLAGAAGGEHHDRPVREARRDFDADLAAPPENHHDTGIRAGNPGRVCCVLHGSDYVLR